MALDYDLRHTEAESKGRQLSYVETKPYALTISEVPNNNELDKLLYADYEVKMVSFKEIKTIKMPESIEFLEINLIPTKINVYANEEEIEFTFDQERLAIELDDSYDEIMIIMEFEKEGREYPFDKPEIGYVEVQATVKGRFGDEDGIFAVILPIADLVTEPSTVMTEESNYQTTLSFALMNNSKPVMKYVKEE